MALDQIDVDEDQNEEKNMSFLNHLDELRGHLFPLSNCYCSIIYHCLYFSKHRI